MANPLKGELGGNTSFQLPKGGIFGLIQKYNEFRNNFGGTNEDARRRVQDLLNSGKMTQGQLDQCEGLARQLESVFK